MASIQVIQGPDKGRTFELAGDESIIGRQSRTVELSDETVSRTHASMHQQDGSWILTEHGSANGTLLNGVKISQPTRVKRGDQIRCGSTLLVFRGDTKRMPRGGGVDIDENGLLVDAAIVATVPSNEDSVIIPTPEAGARAIDNLRLLYNLISEASSILSEDQLLAHTLDKIFELLDADRGFAMLEEDGELKIKTTKYRNDVVEGDPPISRTIIDEVISKAHGVLCANAMGDKRFAAGHSVQNFGIRSAICVPIMGRDKVLGVIHVDCGVSEHTYSTEELRILTAIGYQTGLQIENARLYQATVQSERLAAVGETVAYLSHHIKNILQALHGGIDVVKMGIEAENLGRARQAWPIVERNIDRINRLILNMLAFSKDREPLLEKVQLNDIITDCKELVSHQGDERGVAIVADLDDIPEIPADATGLQQTLLNLVTNAVDAVEDNEGIITLTSRYDSLHRNVILKVIDNGHGIEADQMETIFTPFFSSKGQKGTGLGLAVAKKVIKEHQGTLELDSKVGEGTTFTITLPAIRKDDTRAGEIL